MLACNLLSWLGQNGLLGPDSPKRSPTKRRRLKTVLQELMVMAARVVQTAQTLKLVFGQNCRAVGCYRALYDRLAFG